jgi:hypothetical protein
LTVEKFTEKFKFILTVKQVKFTWQLKNSNLFWRLNRSNLLDSWKIQIYLTVTIFKFLKYVKFTNFFKIPRKGLHFYFSELFIFTVVSSDFFFLSLFYSARNEGELSFPTL